jgi:hypothetical protein
MALPPALIAALVAAAETWPPGRAQYWCLFAPEELRPIEQHWGEIDDTLLGLSTEEAAALRLTRSRGAQFCPALTLAAALGMSVPEAQQGGLSDCLHLLAGWLGLTADQYLDLLDQDPPAVARRLAQLAP